MAEILTPDLCVIGAGSGGLEAAAAARRYGASVVVVERGKMGGARLDVGSVASKALVASARHAHAMRSAGPFGMAAAEPNVNFARLRDHVREAVAGIGPNVSAGRFAALGAEIVAGEGRFVDDRTLAVGETLVRARRFVIATGAAPTLPPIAGLDSVPFFTSDTIFESTRRPTHLVVVGAGAIGAELGQAYRRLGADVTLIELRTPLPDADPELAEIALRRLQEEGVLIRSNTFVPAVAPRQSGGVVVTISANGVEETISASHLLVATGRAPNLDLDLDRAGIRRRSTDPARLELSRGLRTTNRRVYAIGDAAGGVQSAQLAEHQARLVVRSALFGLPVWQRSPLVPSATYTDPEIAEIGLTEEQARRRYKNRFRLVRWPFSGNDRARTRREGFGLCKMITTPAGRILGAGIVGPEAGELIALFSLAIANRLSVHHLERFIAPYPTLAEIVPRLGAEAQRHRPVAPWMAWALGINRMLP